MGVLLGALACLAYAEACAACGGSCGSSSNNCGFDFSVPSLAKIPSFPSFGSSSSSYSSYSCAPPPCPKPAPPPCHRPAPRPKPCPRPAPPPCPRLSPPKPCGKPCPPKCQLQKQRAKLEKQIGRVQRLIKELEGQSCAVNPRSIKDGAAFSPVDFSGGNAGKSPAGHKWRQQVAISGKCHSCLGPRFY